MFSLRRPTPIRLFTCYLQIALIVGFGVFVIGVPTRETTTVALASSFVWLAWRRRLDPELE